jgi:hypothetical protein
MNQAERLANNANRLLNALCEHCEYKDENDKSFVKCRKQEFCNLKEMRILVDKILNGENNEQTGSEQKDS